MIHELLNEFMTDDPGDKLSDGVIFIVKLERMYSVRIIRLQHHGRVESPVDFGRSIVSQAAVQYSYIKYKNIQVINKLTLWTIIV